MSPPSAASARPGEAPSPPPGRLARTGTVLLVLVVAVLAAAIWAVLQDPTHLHALNPVTGNPIILHRGHGVRIPFEEAWALLGIRESPTRAAQLVLGGVLALFVGSRSTDTSPARAWPLRTWLMLGALGALASWLLPVSYELNAEIGDGRTLPGNIGGGRIFGAEIATSYLMVAASHLVALVGSHDAVVAIRVVDAWVAFLLVTSAAALADAAAVTSRGRWLLFVGVLACGTTVQVMGYVETTVLELGAIAVYVAAAARVLGHRKHGPTAPVLAWAALGVGALAHGAGALLLPSTVPMVFPRWGLSRLDRTRVVHHTVLFLTSVVIPFLLVVLPRWWTDDLGNADGGGDHIRFVPADFDRVNPPSPVLYYARFEALHLVDLANALLLAAPIAPLVLLSLPWAGRAARPSTLVVLLSIAALFALVIPVFWNHDFGMWGDWNLASTYLFPLHVASWVWLVQTLERFPADSRWSWVITSALMTVQLCGLAGLALQLY